MLDDNEKWKLTQGFSDATNSPPPADLYERSIWEYNTRQKALLDSNNIPPGHYDGVPINMEVYHSSGGGAPGWSELSGQQRRDMLIAMAIAILFFFCFWIIERKPMESVWDFFALAFISLLVCALSYLVLRAVSKLLGLFRKA